MTTTTAKFQADDSVLGSLSIFDLSDLPVSPALPNGTYQGIFSSIAIERREATAEKEESMRLVVKVQYIAPVELANPEEATELESIDANKELTYNFFLTNEYGQGFAKKLLLPLYAELGLAATEPLAKLNELMMDKSIQFTATRKPANKPTETRKWDDEIRTITTVIAG